MAKNPGSPDTHKSASVTRRRFLQGGAAAAAAAASLTLPHSSEATTVEPEVLDLPAFPGGKRPNILIILCDQMRFPPIYESEATKEFRDQYLKFQDTMRRNGVEFRRHYAASAACVPSRASIITGHYPSLHGTSQTTGAAKEPFDAETFWLDPDAVPTFGDYFRAAGYRTYWRGKWHASDEDMMVPGTHKPIPSYDSTGKPDPSVEALYKAADRLDDFGFSGWIGPEPHGSSPLDSGSSVPEGEQGRDVGFAQQTVNLIGELDRDRSPQPWLVVCSFVNPHDIALWGVLSNMGIGPEVSFPIEDCVPSGKPTDPNFLFDWDMFQQTLADDLSKKPSAQANYQQSYASWMQPILNNPKYRQYYYQLHKNVDEQMMNVMNALLASRYRNDTIVIFTSDHGELLGSHHDMHQKWYQAYDESTRVPLMIWNPKLFRVPRTLETLTSHIDLVPTLLGLAGIDANAIRNKLARTHTDPRPLVGRDLSPLILGQARQASFNDPIYFMTDDDITRGPNQNNFLGLNYDSVPQPNHLETVIARLSDGKIWKYTHYFDNPQFWTSPGTPGAEGVQDVVLQPPKKTPAAPFGPADVTCTMTVKNQPAPDEFEMYNISDDPMELNNLYSATAPLPQQALLAQLLAQQCAAKRLTPCSGDVPGDPDCGQQGCKKPGSS